MGPASLGPSYDWFKISPSVDIGFSFLGTQGENKAWNQVTSWDQVKVQYGWFTVLVRPKSDWL